MKLDMYLEKEQKDLFLRRRQKGRFLARRARVETFAGKNAHDLWDDNNIFLHLSVYAASQISGAV